uniref:Uncharacterized protein n=1 Tax=Eutreptiella gymnastica TaxID=73025 RepID=A0A7S1NCU3_9EUGL
MLERDAHMLAHMCTKDSEARVHTLKWAKAEHNVHPFDGRRCNPRPPEMAIRRCCRIQVKRTVVISLVDDGSWHAPHLDTGAWFANKMQENIGIVACMVQ